MAEQVCITTWISGDYTKGTSRIEYRHVGVSKLHPDALNFSLRIYSTADGARRAARREGFTVMPGVAQGHEAARRWLGLPLSPEAQDRIRRFKAQPLTRTERFTGQFADSFVA